MALAILTVNKIKMTDVKACRIIALRIKSW